MLQATKLVKTYPNGGNKLYALNQVTADIWAVLITPLLFVIAYELMIFVYGRRISGISLKEIMIE